MGRPHHTHCSSCGAVKTTTIAKRNGRESIKTVCYPCRGKQNKARIAGSPVTKAQQIWTKAKARAKDKGIEFSIPQQWVVDKVLAGECEVSKIRLNITKPKDSMNPLAPSIDRINPKRGYIEGNVRVVCWIYNRAKGDGTDQDVIKLMEALYGVHQRQQPIQG